MHSVFSAWRKVFGLDARMLVAGLFLVVSGCATQGSVTPLTPAGEGEKSTAPLRKSYVFSKGQGVLWSPMTWTLSLFQGQKVSGADEIGDALGEFRFRDAQLVLRNTKSQKEVLLPGRALTLADAESAEPEKLKLASSSAALSTDDLSRTFAFESLMSLPQGRYALEAIKGVAIDGATDRPQTLVLPLPNPLDPHDEGPLLVDIQQGAVSVLGRMAFETLMGIRQGKLSAQTRGENLESGRISAWTIARDLGLESDALGDSKLGNVPKLIKANPLVTDLRKILSVETLPLEKPAPGASSSSVAKTSGGVRVGAVVETDCSFDGVLKLVWKAEDQTQEYLGLVPIEAAASDVKSGTEGAPSSGSPSGSPSGCMDGRKATYFVLNMRPANWLLMATEIVSAKGFVSRSKISALAGKPPPALRRYYGLEHAMDFLTSDSGNEQQIRRRFYLPLKDLRAPAGQLYFAGHVAIGSAAASAPAAAADKNGGAAPSTKQDAAASPDGKEGKIWTVSLKRQYKTSQLKQGFGVTRIWSPFSGSLIEADEKTGKLETVLQLSSDASKTAVMAPYVAELRKSLTEAFARCVQKHEESDPLIVVKASLKFRIKSRQTLATMDTLTIDPKTGTESLMGCFRTEFDSFRFKSGVPAGFEAEMKIEAR
jgi:hypothetical protein